MTPVVIRRAFCLFAGRLRRPTTARRVSRLDVRKAYRFFLGREPECDRAVSAYVSGSEDLPALFRSFTSSDEFLNGWQRLASRQATHCEDSAAEVIRSFSCYEGSGEPGFVTDFLGTRTRTEFVRSSAHLDGAVEGYPIPANFHATATEWAGVLRAVAEAQGRFAAAEIGAGWAPWLVACAAAANQRGISDIRLMALEASPPHLEFVRQHFRDNWLDPADHAIVHGAAAAADGEVGFPLVESPAADYQAATAAEAQRSGGSVRATVLVPAYSLTTLLARYDRLDLLHVDIQGAEAEVLSAAQAVLAAKVRRLVVGTHGRDIEQRLLRDLSSEGWRLEADEACRFHHAGGQLSLAIDGCQVWRNPTL
jgi:FkbM family methyltransferase